MFPCLPGHPPVHWLWAPACWSPLAHSVSENMAEPSGLAFPSGRKQHELQTSCQIKVATRKPHLYSGKDDITCSFLPQQFVNELIHVNQGKRWQNSENHHIIENDIDITWMGSIHVSMLNSIWRASSQLKTYCHLCSSSLAFYSQDTEVPNTCSSQGKSPSAACIRLQVLGRTCRNMRTVICANRYLPFISRLTDYRSLLEILLCDELNNDVLFWLDLQHF